MSSKVDLHASSQENFVEALEVYFVPRHSKSLCKILVGPRKAVLNATISKQISLAQLSLSRLSSVDKNQNNIQTMSASLLASHQTTSYVENETASHFRCKQRLLVEF